MLWDIAGNKIGKTPCFMQLVDVTHAGDRADQCYLAKHSLLG